MDWYCFINVDIVTILLSQNESIVSSEYHHGWYDNLRVVQPPSLEFMSQFFIGLFFHLHFDSSVPGQFQPFQLFVSMLHGLSSQA